MTRKTTATKSSTPLMTITSSTPFRCFPLMGVVLRAAEFSVLRTQENAARGKS